MSKLRIEINSDGVQELLKEIGRDVCGPMAQRAADACGDGYAADTHDAGTRVIASVYTETPEAYRDNLENNTILRNLGNA